jgi:hypothetical protein
MIATSVSIIERSPKQPVETNCRPALPIRMGREDRTLDRPPVCLSGGGYSPEHSAGKPHAHYESTYRIGRTGKVEAMRGGPGESGAIA